MGRVQEGFQSPWFDISICADTQFVDMATGDHSQPVRVPMTLNAAPVVHIIRKCKRILKHSFSSNKDAESLLGVLLLANLQLRLSIIYVSLLCHFYGNMSGSKVMEVRGVL